MKHYDHKKIEIKIQKEWDKKKIYNAKEKGKKFYSLIEFPYPSGDGLHVGHPRPYIGMDVISRKRRMEGYSVLYPIGWDAFGLPTENYALKTGIHPSIVTKKNTDNFRKQIKMLGISFDWSREINTTDPGYYKWTQWIFLQFLKKGLAYKAKTEINWCPKDKIGLANEEVIDGKCERCGTETEKKEKEQWMLAITKYADRLDKDLDTVDYPDRVKLSQRNWIGKSEGSEIDFPIYASSHFSSLRPSQSIEWDPRDRKIERSSDIIKVFTTRADTLFGVTYIVLAPEHDFVRQSLSKISNKDEVLRFIEALKNKSELDRTSATGEKTGVELKGIKAVNPANGEEVPVWIADYVLASYGTGAVMAVPAHDERDFAFAKKYNLPMRYVVLPHQIDTNHPPKDKLVFVPRKAVECYLRNPKTGKILLIEWKQAKWRSPVTGGVEEGEDVVQAGIREIQEETGYKNIKFSHHTGVPIRVDFFHPGKNENRSAVFYGMVFDLVDETQDTLAPEEAEKHTLHWLSLSEAMNFININNGKVNLNRIENPEPCFIEDGILYSSSKFSELDSEIARKKITKAVGGKMVTKYKLRDWVFSRQRYWGEPIPVIHCERCGTVPVPEKDLPIKLPKVKSYKPTDTGESPLAVITKWVNTKCPKCKGKAKRETDTMPNWAGSSWYYLRYADPKNKKKFADPKKLKYWTPVDWYNGGMEHTTLHLLYSRFWHKFLYDLKLVPTLEPYKKRTSHGLIMGEGGVKMSKSLGNVVNPNDIVKTYGADTLRVYEMFMGPFEEPVAWSTDSIIGARRFIEKVWRISEKVSTPAKPLRGPRFSGAPRPSQTIAKSSPELVKKSLHKTIKKVSEDIEAMRFNTAISAMMILAGEMEKTEKIDKEDYKKFLQILSPFAPHVTDELWKLLGEKKTINFSAWPQWDESLIKDQEIKIVVQINGKVRSEMLIQSDDKEEDIKSKALALEAVLKFIEGVNVKRVIYVPKRLVNIVI